jgi:hypothetical protein
MTITIHTESRPTADFTPDRTDWRDHALCRQHPAHWFDHLLDDAREDAQDRTARHDQAIAICAQCPLHIREACLTDGIRHKEDGIRGGVLLENGKVTKLAPCGTNGAYRRHKRNGETIDSACLIAHLEHEREREQARREAKRGEVA